MEKICNKCLRKFPATPEYFRRAPKGRQGVEARCKECRGQKFGIHARRDLPDHDGMRICNKCVQTFPLSSEYFPPHKPSKGGLLKICRTCKKRENVVYARENWDRVYRKRREWVAANSEKVTEYARKHYQDNREHHVRRNKEYYLRNKDDQDAKKREYIKQNAEMYAAIKKRYVEKHPEKRRESARSYQRRLLSTIKGRITSAMRASMTRGVKTGKGKLRWVDYTVSDLMTHLERQFLPGMTWDAYGDGWHIGHRRPVSWFKFETADDPAFAQCWALSNLFPQRATENLSAGNRVSFEASHPASDQGEPPTL